MLNSGNWTGYHPDPLTGKDKRDKSHGFIAFLTAIVLSFCTIGLGVHAAAGHRPSPFDQYRLPLDDFSFSQRTSIGLQEVNGVLLEVPGVRIVEGYLSKVF